MYISEKRDPDTETISTKSEPSCRDDKGEQRKLLLSLQLFQRCSAQLSESTNLSLAEVYFTPEMFRAPRCVPMDRCHLRAPAKKRYAVQNKNIWETQWRKGGIYLYLVNLFGLFFLITPKNKPRTVASQRSKGGLASRRPRKKRLFQVTALMVFEVLVLNLWLGIRTDLLKN